MRHRLATSITRHRAELRQLLISAAVVAVTFLIGWWAYGLYAAEIRALVEARSTLSMVLYVGVFTLSIVAAPVSATPLIVLGVELWGVLLATTLSVAGWTLGAIIAFELARSFGRPFVARLFTEAELTRLAEHLPERYLFASIVLLRATIPFDGLSYLLGLLPQVRFSTYLAATIIGLIPYCLVVASLGTLPPHLFLGGLALLGGVSLVTFYRLR